MPYRRRITIRRQSGGAFAASVIIIRGPVVVIAPVRVFSIQQRPWQWTFVEGWLG
jgi:uncharacterized protein (UPF0548 family)